MLLSRQWVSYAKPANSDICAVLFGMFVVQCEVEVILCLPSEEYQESCLMSLSSELNSSSFGAVLFQVGGTRHPGSRKLLLDSRGQTQHARLGNFEDKLRVSHDCTPLNCIPESIIIKCTKTALSASTLFFTWGSIQDHYHPMLILQVACSVLSFQGKYKNATKLVLVTSEWFLLHSSSSGQLLLPVTVASLIY